MSARNRTLGLEIEAEAARAEILAYGVMSGTESLQHWDSARTAKRLRRGSNANSLRGQNSAGFLEICAAFQRDILRRHFRVRVLHAQPRSAVSTSYRRLYEHSVTRPRLGLESGSRRSALPVELNATLELAADFAKASNGLRRLRRPLAIGYLPLADGGLTNLTFAHPCAVVASRHPALSTDVGFRLFAAAKMSQTTMNIAAITGPSTMPFMPKTSSPPSVEISTT